MVFGYSEDGHVVSLYSYCCEEISDGVRCGKCEQLWTTLKKQRLQPPKHFNLKRDIPPYFWSHYNSLFSKVEHVERELESQLQPLQHTQPSPYSSLLTMDDNQPLELVNLLKLALQTQQLQQGTFIYLFLQQQLHCLLTHDLHGMHWFPEIVEFFSSVQWLGGQ